MRLTDSFTEGALGLLRSYFEAKMAEALMSKIRSSLFELSPSDELRKLILGLVVAVKLPESEHSAHSRRLPELLFSNNCLL